MQFKSCWRWFSGLFLNLLKTRVQVILTYWIFHPWFNCAILYKIKVCSFSSFFPLTHSFALGARNSKLHSNLRSFLRLMQAQNVLLGCSTWLTFVMGFILDSMRNSYLHSSHFLVSELLIHLCRQLWCTYCKEPAHRQGEIRGRSGSASQWHILQISIDDVTEVIDMLFLGGVLGLSLLFSVVGIVACPSVDFGLEFCES